MIDSSFILTLILSLWMVRGTGGDASPYHTPPPPTPAGSPAYPPLTSGVLEDKDYWMKLGKLSVDGALNLKRNEHKARNSILFVGDGMGLASITAGRIFKGQTEGKSGEEGYLSFEKFRNVGLLKTYNIDRQVPDSAGTATALFTGVKSNYYMLGLDGTAKFNVCRTEVEAKARVSSIIDWAIAAGKSTGLVTTTRITHATPAATYAHSAHRDWECDTKFPPSERDQGCKDIARQLVEDDPGRNINVLFGGGEQVLRAQVNATDKACHRGDSKDLVSSWERYQKSQKRRYKYVTNKEQLMDPRLPQTTDFILGLFAPGHLPYDKERNPLETPSLEEMTAQAIRILSRNPKGYLLIVEGGRIDHAHHDNLAKIAVEEVVAFDKAIENAVRVTNESDTMIMVTADHSHSFAISGYPKRGNPIGGVGDKTPEGFTYQTMSYINGPGYTKHRVNLSLPGTNSSLQTRNSWKDVGPVGSLSNDRNEVHMAGFWMDYETHGGEDVPVYATGPMGHLMFGVHEQNYVAFAISYAMCIGPYSQTKSSFCLNEEQDPTTTPTTTPNSSSSSSNNPKVKSGVGSSKPFLLPLVVLTTLSLLLL